MTSERVTITLPREMVQEINGRERNRSRFVQRAVTRELDRLRQEELQRSLDNPHADSETVAESGFSEWADLADADDMQLLDASVGQEIRWSTDGGWIEVDE